MKKIDPVVLKEVKYIAVFTLILSALMQAVFLIIGKWNYTVLLGNILGAVAAIGNFLLMGITVQNAVTKDEKDAKNLMKLSQSGRMLLLFVVALVGHLLPWFNTLSLVLTYIFPRFAIMLRPFLGKNEK
ncbi:MAG: hypothetical protein E7533_04165 [Ruminococcaceae bacterium]|nr:hypothetical protein [Oscillospiraceae bacterium]